MPLPSPSVRTLLDSLPSRARLIELARYFGVFVPQKGTKAELSATLAGSPQITIQKQLGRLGGVRGQGRTGTRQEGQRRGWTEEGCGHGAQERGAAGEARPLGTI